jgi:hypothetical protein
MNRIRRGALVLVVGLVPLMPLSGCYLHAARSSPPLSSAEGVRVRLLGQDCADDMGADGEPVSRYLSVALELSNPTPQPLAFTPAAVQLSVDGDRASAREEGGRQQVPPGQTRSFQLFFVHHALCRGDFALAFDGALHLGAQPVALAALHVTPY